MCCAISGRIFPAPSTTSRNCASPTCSTRSTRNWRRWCFPTREDGSNPRICPKCGTGNLSLKLGKFGAFVGCSNYPECCFTRQLGDAANANGENGGGDDGTKVLGKDPYTAEEITLRSGRFGPYVQRGDGKEAKRSSLPKGWTPDSHRP